MKSEAVFHDHTARIEEEVTREYEPKARFLPRLFFYVFRSARSMCLVFTLLAVLLSLMRPVLAFVWREFVDRANTYSPGSSFAGLVVLLLLYYVINFIIGLLDRYVNGYEEIERLDVVQRNRFQELFDTRMYQKLASLHSEYYEIPVINDRISRVFQFTSDAWSGMNREFMIKGYQLIAQVVSLVSILLSLYILSPRLCLLVFVAPLPSLYATYVGNRLNFRFVRDNNKLHREADYYEGLMRGSEAKELKVFSLYDFFYGKWKKSMDIYVEKEKRKIRNQALLNVAASLVSSVAIIFGTVWAILCMTRGMLSLGGLGACMSLIQTLITDTGTLFSSIGSLLSKKNESTMFFDLMDLPEQEVPEDAGPSVHELAASHISYRYPLTDHYVLRDVNVKIAEGEHIALVGENGAGKTTFVRILSGMLTPSEGALIVNGTEETRESRGVRYDATASVLQSPARYQTFTVRENVILGDPKAKEDDAAISRALEAAGFSDADQDALLGKDVGGTDLSGGQWQKLAIARAHYRSRGFILLDEPTGNLDPRAEAEVFRKYMNLSAGKTLIMVTHRISVASLADRIIVFREGRIAEDGTHEELLRRNGEYARLYREQAKWYDR